MTCAQLRTIKSGFQILYAVEQFSSLFSKDKLKHGADEPPVRAKQLSMAVTAHVIWLCACVRLMAVGWCMCAPPLL